MTVRLGNGDLFPTLVVDGVDGGTLVLPRDLAGSFAVVLFFRGSWCPYCCAQLAAFSRRSERFAAAGIRIVALSVDDRATSAALVERLHLAFPIGCGVNAADVAAATGAYVGDGSSYLQSTGFVLDPEGRILTAAYSSGAIGRLVPDDVVGFIEYVDSQRKATAAAAAGREP
jgi:peroxiredoxin